MSEEEEEESIPKKLKTTVLEEGEWDKDDIIDHLHYIIDKYTNCGAVVCCNCRFVDVEGSDLFSNNFECVECGGNLCNDCGTLISEEEEENTTTNLICFKCGSSSKK